MRRARTWWILAWSMLVWVALWGEASLGNLLGGLAVGVFALWVLPPRADEEHDEVRTTLRPMAAVRFVLFFIWALVRASAVVAWEVVTPGSRIRQGIIALPLRTRSPGVATVVANAISLTPGTLTIEVARDPLVLYVHVLHLLDIDSVRTELRQLEEAAMRAFDPEWADTEVRT